MNNKLTTNYQNFLKQKELDTQKIIDNLMKIFNTTPVYTDNIELIEGVEYKDIIKLWDYFKYKNPEYFKKKNVENNYSKEDEKKYSYYYNKFKILDNLFKAHTKKKEHLIVFHIKDSDYSLCKLHSESLWNDIYENVNENDIYKYSDFLTQIPFWNIELNTPGIKKSFLKFLNNTDINNCIHISCYCLD